MSILMTEDQKDVITNRIDVYIRQRNARKNITIISNVPEGKQLKLLKVLMKELNTNGHLKLGEILIQGDKRKEIYELLVKCGCEDIKIHGY